MPLDKRKQTLRSKRVCDRGHTFYKSSDCPVCPRCWSGYDKKKYQNDFPEGISAPALRALHHANIRSISAVSKYSRKVILALHGMGPKSVRLLADALKKAGKSFR